MVQALTAPFALRNVGLSKGGALPASLGKGLDALPNYSKWAKAVIVQESVTYIYDEEAVVQGTVARVAKFKATGK